MKVWIEVPDEDSCKQKGAKVGKDWHGQEKEGNEMS